jgi:hypothetical protein
MLTIASTIHATRAGRLPPTDRARREPASRWSGTGAVSGARFSRIAQLGSTRLRRRTDTPRAYVEPVDRRTSVRFRVSSIGEEIGGLGLMPARTMRATAAECLLPVTSHAIRKRLRAAPVDARRGTRVYGKAQLRACRHPRRSADDAQRPEFGEEREAPSSERGTCSRSARAAWVGPMSSPLGGGLCRTKQAIFQRCQHGQSIIEENRRP